MVPSYALSKLERVKHSALPLSFFRHPVIKDRFDLMSDIRDAHYACFSPPFPPTMIRELHFTLNMIK